MKSIPAILLFAALSFAAPSPLTLWYRQPAKLWVEALPVGNGRLGAMVFGGAARERIQFNEDTVWTGEPHDYAHHGAAKYLPQIRQLLWEGKQKEAEDLAMKEFMSEPLHQKAYQALGDLYLEFPNIQESGVSNYRRQLDLDTGIASVQFDFQGVTYRREVFASYPANVVVVRLTASDPSKLSYHAAAKERSCRRGGDRQLHLRPGGRWSDSLPGRPFHLGRPRRHHDRSGGRHQL